MGCCPPSTSTSHPPDVTHMITAPRPSLFLSLFHFHVLLLTQTKEQNRVGMGTRKWVISVVNTPRYFSLWMQNQPLIKLKNAKCAKKVKTYIGTGLNSNIWQWDIHRSGPVWTQGNWSTPPVRTQGNWSTLPHQDEPLQVKCAHLSGPSSKAA